VSVVVLTEGRQFIEDEETKCCGSLAEEEPRTGERRDHTGQTPLPPFSIVKHTPHAVGRGLSAVTIYVRPSVRLSVCRSRAHVRFV